jgi:hypothetical protein
MNLGTARAFTSNGTGVFSQFWGIEIQYTIENLDG